ncbi:hypothetical protein PsYK624_140050 [Phanerochaete sordida]|uniref:Uncharacterized protein n=1 Tax=Phanerochaete sordida TaxID=48140 RepID=A0A9P3GP50_9APHY|nr:hypothetical protein PsYK624_140050 [Phanerochaete sordida]
MRADAQMRAIALRHGCAVRGLGTIVAPVGAPGLLATRQVSSVDGVGAWQQSGPPARTVLLGTRKLGSSFDKLGLPAERPWRHRDRCCGVATMLKLSTRLATVDVGPLGTVRRACAHGV